MCALIMMRDPLITKPPKRVIEAAGETGVSDPGLIIIQLKLS
jgi:hypothetical protein